MKKKYTSFGFSLPLSQIRKNQSVQILSIPNTDVRSQALRLGMMEGSSVLCLEKLRHGPIVLLVENQQIAIGYLLTQNIRIIPLKSLYYK
ncbi:ferrous iron transport protein A [Sinanaerobacter sp. ZZT-01]|uniref:FeoA family protein n=1 Tax=Sinanaerobacter sp. ZZT-01 TaxID=3111540 RepID=UPI002D77C85A|nr:ferrous iron transport protein A [Sinanaerobacter sp. ZZT-01]WRR93300.1 ferrous iron transport protein A [Sinanaerobacter sp. ZZT-01]